MDGGQHERASSRKGRTQSISSKSGDDNEKYLLKRIRNNKAVKKCRNKKAKKAIEEKRRAKQCLQDLESNKVRLVSRVKELESRAEQMNKNRLFLFDIFNKYNLFAQIPEPDRSELARVFGLLQIDKDNRRDIRG